MKKTFLILNLALLTLMMGIFTGCGDISKADISENKSDYFIKYEENYNQEDTIYVIGHLSPDTDTVCSAIAYADFLNQVGCNAKAVTPGEINAETKYILEKYGIEKPAILDDAAGKQFVLVDHSSFDQSVKNMQAADILAIIDHHATGNADTSTPVLYLGMPVGSTSTIVYNQYVQNQINISKKTAGLMLSAILSDTLGLKLATTTDYDIKAVEKLSSIANVEDYASYTVQMLEAGNEYDSISIEEILMSDYKKYTAGEVNFSVGVVQSANETQLTEIQKQLDNYMADSFDSLEEDMCFVMMVNSAKMETRLLCYGNGALMAAQNAFGIQADNIILKDTASRKKQIVPPLMDFFSTKYEHK